MTGHLLGAAGGLEAGITALAVHHQVAPPTINLDDAGRRVRSRLRARTSSAPLPIEYALSNSFGFGGTNAALLFKRFDDMSIVNCRVSSKHREHRGSSLLRSSATLTSDR